MPKTNSWDIMASRALRLVTTFEGCTSRVEIGGSIRRGDKYPRDIEIIAAPDAALYMLLDNWLDKGFCRKRLNKIDRPIAWGEKFRALELFDQQAKKSEWVKVDIFFVAELNWAVIKLIRTGPASGSKTMVTQRYKNGLLPDRCVVIQGAIWKLPISYEGSVYQRNRKILQLHHLGLKNEELEYRAEAERLHIGRESDWFQLCNLPYIAPYLRNDDYYKRWAMYDAKSMYAAARDVFAPLHLRLGGDNGWKYYHKAKTLHKQPTHWTLNGEKRLVPKHMEDCLVSQVNKVVLGDVWLSDGSSTPEAALVYRPVGDNDYQPYSIETLKRFVERTNV